MVHIKYLVISQMGREEVVIDDTLTVKEVRAVLHAVLGANENEVVSISCCGKRIDDQMGCWGEAMVTLFPQVNYAAPSATPSFSVYHKLHCYVGAEKAEGLTSANGQDRRYGGGSFSMPPELMKNNMNSVEREQVVSMYGPMVEAMAENPEFLMPMLKAQGLNPEHPKVQELMRDKELLKRMLMASFDPDARRAMTQEMNLQMAQIEAMPEGSYMLHSLMDQMADEKLFTDPTRTESDLHCASEENSRPNPTQSANKEVLPNPWDNPPAANNVSGMNMLQGNPMGGLGGMGMMPGMWGRMPPQSASSMSAQQQQALTQLMSSMGGGPWGMGAAAPSAPQAGVPANSSNSPSSSSNTVSQAELRRVYSTQLVQLQSLGFEDEALCLEALAEAGGDIGGAVDYIDMKHNNAGA